MPLYFFYQKHSAQQFRRMVAGVKRKRRETVFFHDETYVKGGLAKGCDAFDRSFDGHDGSPQTNEWRESTKRRGL